jgi:hypothetical protein
METFFPVLTFYIFRSDTGIMTLFCLMNFDGSKLAVHPTEVIITFMNSKYLRIAIDRFLQTTFSFYLFITISPDRDREVSSILAVPAYGN